MPIKRIEKEEARKCLMKSLVFIGSPLLLVLLCLGMGVPFSAVIFTMITFLTFMIVGFVSLTFYFINQEIMHGMWMRKKERKMINNRNIVIGRRVQVAIILSGLSVLFIAYIIIISTLGS